MELKDAEKLLKDVAKAYIGVYGVEEGRSRLIGFLHCHVAFNLARFDSDYGEQRLKEKLETLMLDMVAGNTKN